MIFIFKDNPKRIKEIELRETRSYKELHSRVPEFCFGEKNLKRIWSGENPSSFLARYSSHWFSNIDRHISAPVGKTNLEKRRKYISFPSLLGKKERVLCKYSFQKRGPGKKVALITVMHWNGILKKYDKSISFIRNMLLPLSTVIFVPSHLNRGSDMKKAIDYESVGPNLGLMISRFQKNVFDIQELAWILKNEFGFDEVGIYSFSMGTCYSLPATLGNPSLFDFAIFHLLADDFYDALMKGVGTTRIADKIKNNVEDEDLRNILKILSPGAYEKKFKRLPEHIRVVQAKYDHVFGPKNVSSINKKVRTARPDAEIETEPLGHNCFGSFPFGLKILYNDMRFIYEHTGMKAHKFSKFFVR